MFACDSMETSAPSPAQPTNVALPTAVRWIHQILTGRLKQGDIVVDATAGNGHDTLFLARHVLPEGQVFAFDIQQSAIDSTAKRLQENGYVLSVENLIHSGHETLSEKLPADLRGKIQAITFNLGYLPGGDKNVITQTSSTLSAIQQSLEWLAEDGLLTVVAYPGHEGGRDESLVIEQWIAALPPDAFEAQKIGFLNFRPTTPFCMVVRKRTWQPTLKKPV